MSGLTYAKVLAALTDAAENPHEVQRLAEAVMALCPQPSHHPARPALDAMERSFANHTERIAQHLEKMGAEVRRQGERRGSRLFNDVRFGAPAADILHTVAWGIANLHLDAMARDAALGDMYDQQVYPDPIPEEQR
jgi:hypothetical protein